MFIVVYAVVRCVVLLPKALCLDVMYNITKQYKGNPDWVAQREM